MYYLGSWGVAMVEGGVGSIGFYQGGWFVVPWFRVSQPLLALVGGLGIVFGAV